MSVAEIELLKQQKKEIEDNIVAVNNGVKVGNPMELLNELNAVSNKISDLEYQAQIEAQHVALVEETKAETAYLLDTLEIGSLSISQLSASAEAYDILRQGLQMFIDEKDAKMLEQLKLVKEEAAKAIAELRSTNAELVASIEEREELVVSLRSALANEKDAVEDLESKRAAQQIIIDEQQAEIDRLNSRVTDLQTEAAIGARDAVKVITSDDLKAKADAYKQAIQDSLIPIYDLHWDEDAKPAQSVYIAKLAKNDETVRFPWTQKSKYREVTAEQANTFRAEAAQQVDTISDGVLEVEEQPVTVPAFQSEDSTTGGLDQSDAGSEVAGKTVEERLQALELAVFGKVEVEAA
ncbi:hypothetical protein [Paenibacillus jilunlii]|uniref:Uncharacterized protein n=1 Tax=Paenibacillus jilunlii TaxID=682956 RepID=A0A1H0A0F7_9BACL|nr:hypothetical protein [Paenibacillus jilunlii]KWX79931.1 hypothetical protein AML91_01820 [Paenibacillus jilunlii]SDN26857.1 hypothetical protein SAMN05216191_13418 [Paenibacillus jilunlii]